MKKRHRTRPLIAILENVVGLLREWDRAEASGFCFISLPLFATICYCWGMVGDCTPAGRCERIFSMLCEGECSLVWLLGVKTPYLHHLHPKVSWLAFDETYFWFVYSTLWTLETQGCRCEWHHRQCWAGRTCRWSYIEATGAAGFHCVTISEYSICFCWKSQLQKPVSHKVWTIAWRPTLLEKESQGILGQERFQDQERHSLDLTWRTRSFLKDKTSIFFSCLFHPSNKC